MSAESTREVERIRAVYAGYDDENPARWSAANPGNRANHRDRARKLERALREAGLFPLGERRVLDVGCGEGDLLLLFADWGARRENLVGVDLLDHRVRAGRRAHPGLDLRQGNAEALEFADASFDVVFFSTVFSSILDDGMAEGVAREAARVLRPGGVVLWHDVRYGNPRNPHLRGMPRRRVEALFPGFRVRLRTASVLPPLVRRLGPLTGPLFPVLNAIPFLRSHLLGVLVKPGA